MRSVAVVGAGQAGILLAFALKMSGYKVALFSNKTPKQIRTGYITSSQVTFDSALQIERKWGLDLWQQLCPQNLSVTFTLRSPDTLEKMVEWKGLTKKPFQSVDQRLKFSVLLEKFQDSGGKVVFQDVQLNDLNEIAEVFELVIVSGGKGDIRQAFQRDDQRSLLAKSARVLACMYVNGMIPETQYPGVRGNIIPGIGEYFTTPGLTINGNCEMMLFEGIPGGAFDVWNKFDSPEEMLTKGISLLNRHAPWEAEKCKNVQLTDSKAALIGCFTPVVKRPVLKLASGKLALGMGDTVVLNDPVAGQGANNAIKCAEIYINSVIKRGIQAFDECWMQETFEQYWSQCAEAATKWTNMLLSPPPPHVLDLLAFASSSPQMAETLANGFDNPKTLFPWIADPEQVKFIIKQN